jgi:hypothetical protein
MLSFLRACWKMLLNFRGYKPQPVTPLSVWRWLSQFPVSSRLQLILLLDHVIYVSEKATIQKLVSLNQDILARLRADDIELDKVIYVAIDVAGSSGHVMLNLLRDAENLERRGARLVDSKDTYFLKELTGTIGSGAIIYVDDFAGTGKQFRRNRDWTAQFILGTFSEFFLAPAICEEAYQRIEESGVVPVSSFVHTTDQRPLHRESKILTDDRKSYIIDLCKEINPNAGLGFGNLATMVVFYRNAPNTMPLVFRGSLKQSPYRGIFPRSDDLAF